MVRFLLSFRQHLREHVLWFVLLFGLIFLGDGKQEIVDVAAAAGLMCLFVFYKMVGKVIVPVPRPVLVAWGGLLCYLAIRTFFSDSVGYSVTALVRWIMAYLVFVLFYSIAQGKKIEKSYQNSLVWFGALVVAASAAVTLFHPLGETLERMNLLYPAYGHNHVANIIIFVFPLVLCMLARRKDRISVAVLVFFGIALLGSFARGAWILASCYLGYFLLTTPALHSRPKRAVLGVLGVIIISLFLLPNLSVYLPQGVSQNPIFQRQVIKDSILANRLPYWKEVALAATERPLFGAGPGTFYLLAKRFQVAPGTHSWFAHSFPLELLSEIGIVGLMFVAFLAFSLRRVASASGDLSSMALRDGALLTLLYSLYEINLNFLVIWLLFWSTLGVLFARVHPATPKRPYTQHLLSICMGIVTIFYGSSLAASLFGLFPGLSRLAFYTEPYIVGRAIASSSSEKDLALFFHKKNPEVLIAFAKLFKQNDPELAAQFFEEGLRADKTNVEHWKSYMQFAQAQPAPVSQNAIRSYVAIYGPSFLHRSIPGPTPKEVSYVIDFLNHVYLSDENNQRTNLVRMFYGFGLASLFDDSKRTQVWWALARDIAPEWGYFHVELASLWRHVAHNEEEAIKILQQCQKHDHPKALCAHYLDRWALLPAPGSFLNYIQKIPLVD